MKIHGKPIGAPQSVTVPIPRTNADGQNEDIVFICAPVLDFSEFEQKVPAPKPPLVMRPGAASYPNVNDKTYLAAQEKRADLSMAWTFLKSIGATPGLEWSTVDMDDPETWLNHKDELSACFTPHEVLLISYGVLSANSPSEEKQQEALERFTSSQGVAPPVPLTSPTGELANTPSGEPAND